PSSRRATTTTTALSMKLLVDTQARRVLFAEASKDVVDFLFSLLALPVGTAVKLLGKESMVGCVGSLYGSVEKLDGTYVQPGAAKDALLHPSVLSPAVSSKSSLLGLPAPPSPQAKTFYRCSKQCICYSGGYGSSQQARCNSCRTYMTESCGTYCPSYGGGHEREGVRAGHRDVHGDGRSHRDAHVLHLQHHPAQHIRRQGPQRAPGEDRVQLGYDQGLEILKASLQSKTVLTDVFLKPASNA
uniref:Uncharacterized protein n=1 Tax=Aegilops tauschii subsp. strangulata TaxID=200361 RepID=A0A453E3Y3_AEGTS